jgi:hypothetical protein
MHPAIEMVFLIEELAYTTTTCYFYPSTPAMLLSQHTFLNTPTLQT